MPGLIDAHLHPMLGAMQFDTTWIASPKKPNRCSSPGATTKRTTAMSRERLDTVSSTYPLNYNGITTVADMNTGGVNWDLEVGALERTFGREDSPVR